MKFFDEMILNSHGIFWGLGIGAFIGGSIVGLIEHDALYWLVCMLAANINIAAGFILAKMHFINGGINKP